jgi:uncharacterized phage-like protein YoqJ
MILAGTGHRPKYLPCRYNENHPWLISLKNKIREKLDELRPSAVISGVAIGFDTWLAQSALDLKIPLWCYIPFPEQGSKWPGDSKKIYKELLDKCEKSVILSPNYSTECFFTRDKAMVNDADKIIALWNPDMQSGGTYYTVQYTLKKKKEVINLWNTP